MAVESNTTNNATATLTNAWYNDKHSGKTTLQLRTGLHRGNVKAAHFDLSTICINFSSLSSPQKFHASPPQEWLYIKHTSLACSAGSSLTAEFMSKTDIRELKMSKQKGYLEFKCWRQLSLELLQKAYSPLALSIRSVLCQSKLTETTNKFNSKILKSFQKVLMHRCSSFHI